MNPKPEAKQKLTTWLEREIDTSQADIDAFMEKLANPEPSQVDAFRYRGGPALIAAARLDVFSQVHKALTSEESKATLKTIHEYAEKEVVNKGVHIGSSTALLAEHCDRAVLAAWTEVYKNTAQIRDFGEPLFI